MAHVAKALKQVAQPTIVDNRASTTKAGRIHLERHRQSRYPAIAARRRSGAAGLSERTRRGTRSAGRGSRRLAPDPAARSSTRWCRPALTIALPPGYEAQVRPRSGLAAKHGVTVLNAPGTIDADYRGEIGVLLINHGATPFPIRRGERIAQMVIALRGAGGTGFRHIALRDRPRRRRLRFDRALNRLKSGFLFTKIAPIKFNTALFLRCSFAFTIWTLTGRLRLGILLLDSRTALADRPPMRRAQSRAVWGEPCRA